MSEAALAAFAWGDTAVVVAPLLPPLVLAGAALLLALGIVHGLGRRMPGMALRGLAALALLAALLDPSAVIEDRVRRSDVAVVVVDDSPSQAIGRRRQQTEEALASLQARLAAEPDLDLRVVRAGGRAADGTPDAIEDTGTRLFEALGRALADLPRARLSGVILVTDGQVHDAALAPALFLDAPVHALLTGARGETDRRLRLESGLGYAIVGKPFAIKFRVEDEGAPRTPVRVQIRRDGQALATLSVMPGKEGSAEVTLARAGPSVIEIEAQAGPNELTLENNRAVLTLNGVRDRLRVLLISGEPHPGERTWRTLLKADPSVDLVHFTILRPPEKQDSTPLSELSLITFPTRELFEVRLPQFDLVVLDRYRRRGVLPLSYYANLAEYVRKGGALLLADGPPYATSMSVFQTPLGDILPAVPTGQVIEAGFRPALTAAGKRHPVTAELSAAPPGQEKWGRWFRLVEATARSGTVLMTGPGGRPLLVLDRQGEGRVANLLSDQVWLWARGYEGGGPQAELLRRLAHWLMKEPTLEENDVRARVAGGRLEIERRSLEPRRDPVAVTLPDGRVVRASLEDRGDGRAVGAIALAGPGLYRVRDGERTALAAAGSANPIESADVRATETILKPVTEATGGGVAWLAEGMPELRRLSDARARHGSAGGRAWLGLKSNADFVVTGVRRLPLLPGFALLAVLLGAFASAWWRESR